MTPGALARKWVERCAHTHPVGYGACEDCVAAAVREALEMAEDEVRLQMFRTENMKEHSGQAWADISGECAAVLAALRRGR